MDFVLGYGPVILGHSHEEFSAQVAKLLSNGTHFPGYSTTHERYLELLAKAGCQKDMCAAFFKTSSESMSAALRIAALLTRKRGVLRCGFLGWHDRLIANTPAWHSPPEARKEFRFRDLFCQSEACEVPAINWSDMRLDTLERLIDQNHQNIGCAAFDLYQLRYISADTMRRAISLCEQKGIVTVLDETKTSGRCGPLGIGDFLSLAGDMTVVGKAIANGAPLSLLLMKDEFAEIGMRARIGGTYSKELYGPACAIATYNVMTELDGYTQLRSNAKRICSHANSIIKQCKADRFICMVSVVEDCMIEIVWKAELTPQVRNQLARQLLDAGILFLIGHPSFLSVAHSEQIDAEFCQRFHAGLSNWIMSLD